MLEKYKDHLDRVRRERSQATSPTNLSNGLTTSNQSPRGHYNQSESSIHDQTWPSSCDQSRPSSSAALQNGTSRSPLPLSSSRGAGKYGQSKHLVETPEAGYFEGPAEGLAPEIQPRADLVSVARKLRSCLSTICQKSRKFGHKFLVGLNMFP